jgi:hypothetical protein
MKQTPLVRKTPLRAKPRAQDDKVTPEVAAFVFARDRVCIAYRYDHSHICRNRWGRSHAPDDKSQLTLDHVWREGVKVHYASATMGDRAKSDPRHLVVACHAVNVGVPSADLRAKERDYLTEVAP